ncbi:MAG: phage antirepressor KilAC domain-containing protein [Eubacterium sp.]|nr:phage antirepressor KilAC domain-containing protein [Eubacterium sp.]
MNEIQRFNNEQFGEIRTVEENNKVLFCGSDVAKALGYAKPQDAVARHCREDGSTFHGVIDSLGREQQAKFIDEGNVYRLICNSKLPSAEQFESWVFDEVLPSIRKHGLYATNELIANPDLAIAAFTALKEERERNNALKTTVAVQEQQIAELKPKASYYDLILNCKDLVSINKIAKDYGKSAQWLNCWLHDNGVQYRQGKIWLLYQKYAEKGYTSTKTHNYNDDKGVTHSKPHTYWTQKGRLFIYELLKRSGIVPTMEKNSAAN